MLLAHELVTRQARATPDRPAVEDERGVLTYAELDCWSDRIAYELIEEGFGEDAVVGLLSARGRGVAPRMLGILKAGSAYLPLDPDYPPERLAFMLRDSGAQLVVGNPRLLDRLGSTGVVMRDTEQPPGGSGDAGRVERRVHPDSLAYVIYTSGSTGTPKGVAMPHRPLTHLLSWQLPRLRGGAARTLQFTSLGFDVSVQEIFSTLAGGGTLVCPPDECRADLEQLAAFVTQASVERIFLPFVALNALAQVYASGVAAPAALREVITAGEQLRITPAVETLFERTGARLDNQYGPTETHVVIAERLEGPPAEWPRLPPIGKPLPHAEAVVVDGKLFLGGEALARCYLRRPALTAERFVPDPAGDGGRLYDTGDRVRRLPEGGLEFVGRGDDQVKIRGYRVEPGEVEAVLGAHPRVAQCAVIATDAPSGERRLHAYVTSAAAAPEAEALRAFVASRLPDFMVPSRFFVVDRLPLTPSGKLDRRGLREAQPRDPSAAAEEETPKTAVESRFVEILAEVLELEGVEPNRSFLELGGDSLAVARVQARVRETFGASFPARRFFEPGSVRQLAAAVEPAGAVVPPLHGTTSARRSTIPMSFGQLRLFFADRLVPDSLAYNVPALIELPRAIEKDAVRAALAEIARRHEILRTTFDVVDGEPVQLVGAPQPVALPEEDLGELEDEEWRDAVRRLLGKDLSRPLDLAAGPPWRARIARAGSRPPLLLLSMHHIVTDGWSLVLLAEELRALLADGRPLPDPPLQYGDYAVEQRSRSTGRQLTQALSYWEERLHGAPGVLELPSDKPRPSTLAFEAAEAPLNLGARIARDAASVARAEGATPFMVLFAAFAAWLSRLTGERDLLVAMPAAARDRPELERVFGFFVNTVVIRVDLEGTPSFRELVRRVRDAVLDAFDHQDVPFELLVERLALDRESTRPPLVQVMFAYDNTARQAASGSGVRLLTPPLGQPGAGFELTMSLWEERDGLEGRIHYLSELFDARTVEGFARGYRTLLAAALADPEARVTLLPLLDADERERVTRTWNATARSLSPGGLVHERFERHADRAPSARALELDGLGLSYGEVERDANRVAAALVECGVGPETFVALLAERSFEFVLAALGILKAGGALLALHPVYPRERLTHMLDETAPKVVLTQRSLLETLPTTEAETLLLDEDSDLWDQPNARVAVRLHPRNLAYVIYTSGSTGRPKGVLLEHEGLANLVSEELRLLEPGPGSRVLQFSSPSFDAMIWELSQALCSGATLVLTSSQAVIPGREFADLLRRARITHATLPPSVLTTLTPEELPELRTVVSAGEACPPTLPRRWSRDRLFGNGYGPSEATVCSTFARLTADEQKPPIGRPLANKTTYVLDGELQPFPVHVRGTLWLGGAGLARGYLGRAAMTSELFRPDPFSPTPGARMYCTGDLARYRSDGILEFLGRADDQIKIRGFRVELGEIRSVLLEHPHVKDCVAVVREYTPDDRRIIAYVVPDEADADHTELRAAAAAKLPHYMIPAAFVELERLPLTANGKVDERALPEPDFGSDDVAGAAPETPAERTLARIWRDVLRLGSEPTLADRFFTLGGHSLLAISLVDRVHEELGVELPLRVVFEEQSLGGMAAAIEALCPGLQAELRAAGAGPR